jgi:hypothetical protein
MSAIAQANDRVHAIGDEHTEPRSDSGSQAIADVLGIDKDELDAFAEAQAAAWIPVLLEDFMEPVRVYSALRMIAMHFFFAGCMYARDNDNERNE